MKNLESWSPLLGLLGVALVIATALWIDSAQPFTFGKLPPPNDPVPSYLKIYPEPGVTVRPFEQEECLQPEFTEDGLVIIYIDGDLFCPALEHVCVLLNTYELFEIGDFWDYDFVVASSSVILDDQNIQQISARYVGPVIAVVRIDDQDNEIGSSAPPIRMCWQGAAGTGYHLATFTFEEYSYTWWYRIER